MFNGLLNKIHKKLRHYVFFQKMVDILKRTPSYAIHWYILMILGIVIVIINVGLAWFAFRGVSVQVNNGFSQSVTATTIRRETLQEVINIYRAREIELRRLKLKAPIIIDPGR